MADEALRKLAEDIKANGLCEPAILAKDGRMLDGRNRMLACEMAGVELRTVVYEGEDEIAFVISKNLHRRHLSVAELAMIAADLALLKHGGDRGNQYTGGKPGNVSAETLPKISMTKSAEIVGKDFGIGRAIVMDAKAIKEHGAAEIIDMARASKVGLRDTAAYVRNTPKSEQKADVAEIRRKGSAINAGNIKGKKHLSKSKAPKIISPPYRPPSFADMTAEDMKGLDPKQRVHTRTLLGKQLADAQTITTVLLAQINAVGSSRTDADTFFAAIDRMLAWQVKPGARFGEQHDYAARARKTLDQLDRVLPVAFKRITSLHAAWQARSLSPPVVAQAMPHDNRKGAMGVH
jgi:hypothetical protein